MTSEARAADAGQQPPAGRGRGVEQVVAAGCWRRSSCRRGFNTGASTLINALGAGGIGLLLVGGAKPC